MTRRWREPLKPMAGGGFHFPPAMKSIRFARHGCANRPFFHIVVNMAKKRPEAHPIEQLGTFDPLPNKYNEKLCSINIERLRYWLAHKTKLSTPVAVLLGLAGLFPLHNQTYYQSIINRREEIKRHAEQLQKTAQSEETAKEENAMQDGNVAQENSS